MDDAGEKSERVEIYIILVLFGLGPKLAHLRKADAAIASSHIFYSGVYSIKQKAQ